MTTRNNLGPLHLPILVVVVVVDSHHTVRVWYSHFMRLFCIRILFMPQKIAKFIVDELFLGPYLFLYTIYDGGPLEIMPSGRCGNGLHSTLDKI